MMFSRIAFPDPSPSLQVPTSALSADKSAARSASSFSTTPDPHRRWCAGL
jgi:hypothetical protein